MSYKILVQRDANQITARALLFPEITVTGTDEQAVLEQLRQELKAVLQNSQLIDLDLSLSENDPWLQFVGMWADDKDWDAFQAEIKTYRDSFDIAPQ